MQDTTTRHTETLDLEDASIGDRVDPHLIPRSTRIDTGERVSQHITKYDDPEDPDDRTFSVRLVAHGYHDQYGGVQNALVYDPDADAFARLSGHTNSGAWNQAERDYKIREIGSDVDVLDVWDVEISDMGGETPEEYVSEWVGILFGNARYGDVIENEIEQYDGKKLRLYDVDGRRATAKIELTDD